MTVIEQRAMEAIQSINRKTKDSTQIDWEQRRYEIAKDTLAGITSSLQHPYDSPTSVEELAKLSLRYADALIDEIKKTSK